MYSLIFGLVHLLNFLSPQHNPGYVALQIILGCVIGFQYLLTFLLNDSLTEPLLLHVTNNLLSSFLSRTQTFDLTNPYFIIPLLQTFVVYGYFISKSWTRVKVELEGTMFSWQIQKPASSSLS